MGCEENIGIFAEPPVSSPRALGDEAPQIQPGQPFPEFPQFPFGSAVLGAPNSAFFFFFSPFADVILCHLTKEQNAAIFLT